MKGHDHDRNLCYTVFCCSFLGLTVASAPPSVQESSDGCVICYKLVLHLFMCSPSMLPQQLSDKTTHSGPGLLSNVTNCIIIFHSVCALHAGRESQGCGCSAHHLIHLHNNSSVCQRKQRHQGQIHISSGRFQQRKG